MHAQVHAQVHAHSDGKRGFHHSGNAYLRHGCGFVDIKGRKRYNNQSKGATFLCSAPRTTASLRALKSGPRAAAFPLRSGAPQRPGTLSRRAPPARAGLRLGSVPMPLIAHRGLWVPRGRFAQVGDSVLCDWQQGADDSRCRAIFPCGTLGIQDACCQ